MERLDSFNIKKPKGKPHFHMGIHGKRCCEHNFGEGGECCHLNGVVHPWNKLTEENSNPKTLTETTLNPIEVFELTSDTMNSNTLSKDNTPTPPLQLITFSPEEITIAPIVPVDIVPVDIVPVEIPKELPKRKEQKRKNPIISSYNSQLKKIVILEKKLKTNLSMVSKIKKRVETDLRENRKILTAFGGILRNEKR